MTNEDATFEELADVLTSFYASPGKLDKALGLVLGVGNVEEALAEQQKVAEVTDDTDLEKEAYFDINAFLAARGLNRKKGRTEQGPPPDFVLRNEM